METTVLLANLVLMASLVLRVLRETRDLPESRVLWENKAPRDLQVPKGMPELRDQRVATAPRANSNWLGWNLRITLPDTTDRGDHLAARGHRARLGRKGNSNSGGM